MCLISVGQLVSDGQLVVKWYLLTPPFLNHILY